MHCAHRHGFKHDTGKHCHLKLRRQTVWAASLGQSGSCRSGAGWAFFRAHLQPLYHLPSSADLLALHLGARAAQAVVELAPPWTSAAPASVASSEHPSAQEHSKPDELAAYGQQTQLLISWKSDPGCHVAHPAACRKTDAELCLAQLVAGRKGGE